MRATPSELWSSIWNSALTLAENGMVLSEMMRASSEVVRSRSRSILDATRDPFAADHGELRLMVSEKVEAFSEAGISAIEDIRKIQKDALGQWQQMMLLASGGRPLTGSEAASLLARLTRMLDRATSAGGKMLAPIHSRATANAKRLRKRR